MFRFIPAGDGSNGGLRTDACLEYDREVQVYGEEVREGNVGIELAAVNNQAEASFATRAKVFHPVPRIVKQKWRIYEREPFFPALKAVLEEMQQLREATADEELAKKIGEQSQEITALQKQIEVATLLSEKRGEELTAALKEITGLKESVTSLTAERDTLASEITNLRAENYKAVGEAQKATKALKAERRSNQ